MTTPKDKVEATARPWALRSRSAYAGFVDIGPADNAFFTVAHVTGFNLSEATNNANLIVTAVNERDSLLERVRVLEGALRPIVSCYGLGQPAEKFTEQVGPLILDARAALAAKGE
jgi:hypothetical protein